MKKKNIGDVRINPKKKKKKKIIIISIIVLVLVILISAFCVIFILDIDDTLPGTEEIYEPEPGIVERRKITIVDEDSNERPIAIMIDNNVGNNLHTGLQDAYVTYEIIVEGGLTRIMAIYKDKDVSKIGPVRSSRHYFLDYALEYDAIYAHYGWSTYASNDINALGVDNINGLYDDAYWRDSTIAAPHNVFTSIDTLYEKAEDLGYSITSDDWEVLTYSYDAVNLNTYDDEYQKCEGEGCIQNSSLIKADNVVIPYSYNQTRSYVYDSTRQVYLRYMNNEAHIDRETGAQYYYKNIIIMQVSNHTLDSVGRQDLDTVGSGSGYYITNGYALPITWTKNSRSSKTIYQYPNGDVVNINDGNTFIQIEPTTYSPQIS